MWWCVVFCLFADGLLGLGVVGGALLVGGVMAAGAVALAGMGIAKLKNETIRFIYIFHVVFMRSIS